MRNWKYYNHAALPTTPPHMAPDLSPIVSGDIWKLNGSPLFARWTTDFDCGYETNWWYIIKDQPFDINALKAKRRYEIKKGIKNFDAKTIEPRKICRRTMRCADCGIFGISRKVSPDG